MTTDSSPPSSSNDLFANITRRPFKRDVKVNGSSSSSSSDSSSNDDCSSRSSSSSSSSNSWMDLPGAKQQDAQSTSPSVLKDSVSKDFLESSENSERPVVAASLPRNINADSIAMSLKNNHKDDEFAHFDDDDLPWDMTSPENREDHPATVIFETLSPKTQTNRDVQDILCNVADESKGSCIGPSHQWERKAEVQPNFYAPLPYRDKQPSIVHHLSLANRPLHIRQRIPISRLFQNPVNQLWKSKFSEFNHLQSEVSTLLVSSNDSIVVSAPTGAGKTAVFEMAIARHINTDLEVLRESSHWHQRQLPMARKIVYMAPSKALCEERYDDWSKRLSELKLGIRSAMITGDAEPGDSFRDIAASHLIITTPEKWDSITRRWTETYTLLASVKLVLVDEVHMLGDPSRGCCLESILCRMKTIFRATQSYNMTESEIKTSSFSGTSPDALSSNLRIVAVSATLPNIGDFAGFLNANVAYAFDDSYRPVPLTTYVTPCGDIGKNEFMFAKNMNHRVPGVIKQFSDGKPTIVFCHTKKETEILASELSRVEGISFSTQNHQLAGQTHVPALQRCLLRGVAYHNAGLDAPDRKLIEKAFLEGNVKCLCATSTLAVGVNLPAHLVVIKGTTAWRGSSGYQEIEKASLLQMMGRAGRAGFDTSGIAVIMTDSRSEEKYKRIGASLEIVESQVLPRLVQLLNTEISQKVITSFRSAKEWVATTFLFQRIRRNPAAYGIKDPSELDHCLTRICGSELKKLDDSGLIEVSTYQNGDITPLFGSHVMNHHLLEFPAMKLIMDLPHELDSKALVINLSRIEGLHKPVRRNEKKILNEVHKTIKYKLDGPPSKVRIQQPDQKAFVLLQCAIGQLFLDDFTLRQEMSSMVEFSTRILAAAEEYSVYGSKNGNVALQSLKLRRSMAVSLWSSGDGVLNQLRGVGQDVTGRLRLHQIASFMNVLEATEECIEKAAGRAPPFGNELRKAVCSIMCNAMKVSAKIEDPGPAAVSKWVTCHLIRNNQVPVDTLHDSNSVAVKYTLLAFTDRPNGCLFFQPNVDGPGEYRFRCPDKYGQISIHLVSSLIGLDASVSLVGNEPTHTLNAQPRQTILEEPKPQVIVKDSGVDGKILTKNKIREPNSALKDAFQRQTFQAMNALSKQRTQSSVVTPTSGPSSASMRHTVLSQEPEEVTLSLCHKDSESFQAETPARERQHLKDINSAGFQCQTHRCMGSRGFEEQVSGGRRHQTSTYHRDRCSGALGQGRNNEYSEIYRNEQPSRIRDMIPQNIPKRRKSLQDPHWNKERVEQSRFQERAFKRKRENPFAQFRYDPNDAEGNLDMMATENVSKDTQGQSILPPDAFSVVRRPKTNVFHKSSTRMRSNRRPGLTSQKLPVADVLRIKAAEQLHYVGDQSPIWHQTHHQHSGIGHHGSWYQHPDVYPDQAPCPYPTSSRQPARSNANGNFCDDPPYQMVRETLGPTIQLQSSHNPQFPPNQFFLAERQAFEQDPPSRESRDDGWLYFERGRHGPVMNRQTNVTFPGGSHGPPNYDQNEYGHCGYRG